jgi:hypothetical protein
MNIHSMIYPAALTLGIIAADFNVADISQFP